MDALPLLLSFEEKIVSSMSRVYYLAPIRLPTEKAHGRQIVKTVEALARQGIEIELVIPRRTNASNQEIFSHYGVTHPFLLRQLTTADFFGRSKLGYGFSVLCFFLAFLVRLFSKKATIYTRSEWVAALSRLVTKRVIWEAHEVQGSRVEKWLAKKGVGLVAISHGIVKSFASREISFSRAIVAPDAVDLDWMERAPDRRAELRKLLGVEKNDRVLLYAGSLSLYPWKGVDGLLRLAPALPAPWRLVILGGSPQDIAAWAEKPGAEQIIWHSAVPAQEVASWYKMADALILPNKPGYAASDLYTSPMKLFEYLAAKKLILASRLPSIGEVVSEDEVCFFSFEGIEKDVPRLLKELTVEEIDQKQRAAFALASSFTWDARAEQIKALVLGK